VGVRGGRCSQLKRVEALVVGTAARVRARWPRRSTPIARVVAGSHTGCRAGAARVGPSVRDGVGRPAPVSHEGQDLGNFNLFFCFIFLR
jgi:hypothetical protein